MVNDVGLNDTLSLSQYKCSGWIVTCLLSGFSISIILVTVSLTGEVSSKVPRISGGEAIIF